MLADIEVSTDVLRIVLLPNWDGPFQIGLLLGGGRLPSFSFKFGTPPLLNFLLKGGSCPCVGHLVDMSVTATPRHWAGRGNCFDKALPSTDKAQRVPLINIKAQAGILSNEIWATAFFDKRFEQ